MVDVLSKIWTVHKFVDYNFVYRTYCAKTQMLTMNNNEKFGRLAIPNSPYHLNSLNSMQLSIHRFYWFYHSLWLPFRGSYHIGHLLSCNIFIYIRESNLVSYFLAMGIFVC